MKNAEKVLRRVKESKGNIETFKSVRELVSELELFYDMQKNREVTEEEIDGDVKEIIKNIESSLGDFERIQSLLGDDVRARKEILRIHGLESSDY